MRFCNITVFLCFNENSAGGPLDMAIQTVGLRLQNLIVAAYRNVCKCKKTNSSFLPLYGCSLKICFGKIIFGEKGSSCSFPSNRSSC